MSLADEMMIRAYLLSKDELKMMADQVKLPKSKRKIKHIYEITIRHIVENKRT